MSLTADNLTDLPTPLLSQIFSYILEPPSRALIVLESKLQLPAPLPEHLLAVAKSSPICAEAVADALGARAEVMDSYSTYPLHEWIAVLAPFVKVVSWYGCPGPPKPSEESSQEGRDERYGMVPKYCMSIFTALSAGPVRLQVLDLTSFIDATREEKLKLSDKLISTLKHNGASLRELRLSLNPSHVLALEKVSLPNLQVSEVILEYSKVSGVWPASYGEGDSAKAFMQMLRALEGHADRSINKTTVRELRLSQLRQVPLTVREESCAGLFMSVKVLKIKTTQEHANSNTTAMTKFIALFTNLECLHWKGITEPCPVQTILEACRNLGEVHFNYSWRSYLCPALELDALSRTFRACDGKLRSLRFTRSLPDTILSTLGETNPGLESLYTVLKPDNIRGFHVLLGTLCRKLRKLDLEIPWQMRGLFRDTDWCALAEAVKSATEELCEIQISGNNLVTESEFEAMERAVTQMVKFLGERARKISFTLPMRWMSGRAKGEFVCRLMRSCEDYAKNLECLRLIVGGCNAYIDVDNGLLFTGTAKYGDAEEERETREQVWEGKQRILAALPQLTDYCFVLGDTIADRRLNNMDAQCIMQGYLQSMGLRKWSDCDGM